MSFYKKLFSSILSGVLIFSAVGSAAASDPDQAALEEAAVEKNTYITEEQTNDLIEVLAAVEDLPKEVINEGDEAVVEFLQDNVSDGIVVKQEGDVVAFGVIGCASAIGTAIVTNVFPIAKITKLKSVIKTAGGATTFAKTLISSYNSAGKFKATKSAAIKIAVKTAAKKSGPDTIAAVLEIFNVGAIYGSCFE